MVEDVENGKTSPFPKRVSTNMSSAFNASESKNKHDSCCQSFVNIVDARRITE